MCIRDRVYAVGFCENLRWLPVQVLIQIQRVEQGHPRTGYIPGKILICIPQQRQYAAYGLLQCDRLVRPKLSAQIADHPFLLCSDPDARRIFVLRRHICIYQMCIRDSLVGII